MRRAGNPPPWASRSPAGGNRARSPAPRPRHRCAQTPGSVLRPAFIPKRQDVPQRFIARDDNVNLGGPAARRAVRPVQGEVVEGPLRVLACVPALLIAGNGRGSSSFVHPDGGGKGGVVHGQYITHGRKNPTRRPRRATRPQVTPDLMMRSASRSHQASARLMTAELALRPAGGSRTVHAGT